MIVTCSDSQIVGGTSSTLFSLYQAASPISVMLENTGVNIAAYDFQVSSDGVNFSDYGPPGTPTNNTLLPGQVVFFTFTPATPIVQCIGYASGGSVITFNIVRFFNRSSGAGILVSTT